MTALVTWATDDVVKALLGSHAGLCAGEQVPEAENYAEHLAALAEDTVALGGGLEAARRYVDPVRAPATVEWTVRERGGRAS